MTIQQNEKYGHNVIKALAHPIRLKIVILLQQKEMSVGEINAELETSKPNITKHLNVLRNRGLVKDKRNKNEVSCVIADGFTSVLIKDIVKILSQS